MIQYYIKSCYKKTSKIKNVEKMFFLTLKKKKRKTT